MQVEQTRLVFLLTLCLTVGLLRADVISRRQQCRDFAGDRSNCQRFIRCFYNLRVLFSCASGTAYVPDLQTCVAKELVIDCDDSKNRDEVVITSNADQEENDDYPTIEADLNALEAPMQKSLSQHTALTVTPRQFGCSSYCYNRGVCVLVGQKITCRCPPGFIGVRCQVAQSALATRISCAELPGVCNGGTCQDDPVSEQFSGCDCGPGANPDDTFCYELLGPTIPPTIIPTIPTNPTNLACSPNPCQNGATCEPVPGGGFRCICATGFTGLRCEISASLAITSGCGNNCQIPALTLLNQCQTNPCRNGGSCYLNQNVFACACLTGFTGVLCETSLALANPCYSNPCLNTGTCQVVVAGVYRCVCPVGLLGVRCEQRVCDPNPCLYGGVCLPLGNAFQCQCPAPYTGTCCELILATTAAPNPCSSLPCFNGGTCTATSATTFVCSCTASYYGRCCEVRNYCQPNPCYNGGSCIPTINGYLCQCIFPNSGSNCEVVLSTVATRPACACILCPCPTPSVTVVNPCLPNPCQNNGGCAVIQNNPQCFCQPSFAGSYCQYQRKRSLTNTLCANVTCSNGGDCYVDETGPQCSCKTPYFGQRCELINRPRTCNPSPCGKNGQCVTTDQGYECVCDQGTTGVLCEQMSMPKDYRWCPLDCQSGTTCVYEGSTPKCRVLSVY